jgi:putative hydrolase of the HAD superfamily
MKKKLNVENIIFDFGGVILNIDYQLTIDAFKEIGMDNFEKSYSQATQIHLFDNLEIGNITPDEFRNGIRKVSQKDLSDEKIDYAWNKIILDLPEKRIRLLTALKNKYNIFLLSNTNRIHYDLYIKQLQKFGYNNFDEIFKKAYFSFEIGLRKPDLEIFEYIINKENINPDKTVFIDDSIQHIEAAVQLGIQTYHLGKNEDILNLFDEKLELILEI